MRRIVIIGVALLLVTCHKEIIDNPDCEKLIAGIQANDEMIVKTEIEKLTGDLSPLKVSEDQLGHAANLNLLAERLNEKCTSITATVECYACIETYPAISEIKLEFEADGGIQFATIDILTPGDDILRYAGMHYYIGGEN